MLSQDLRVSVITRMLKDQVADFQKDIERKKQLESDLNSLLVEMEVKERSMGKLKEDLLELGAPFSDISNGNTVAKDATNWSLSHPFTFQIMQSDLGTNGMDVKLIIEKYKEKGITCHPRQIFEHLERLIAEDRVYQTNPEQKRGKRYRIKNV